MVQKEILQLVAILIFIILFVPIMSTFTENSGTIFLCSKEANLVITKEKLTKVRACQDDVVLNGSGTPVHKIRITFEAGQDCMSGCIYDIRYATVTRVDGAMRVCVLSESEKIMNCQG